MAKFLFTEATQKVDCPRCKERAGSYCRSPKGRKTDYPHGERVQALERLPSFNLADFQCKVVSFDEFTSRFRQ